MNHRQQAQLKSILHNSTDQDAGAAVERAETPRKPFPFTMDEIATFLQAVQSGQIKGLKRPSMSELDTHFFSRLEHLLVQELERDIAMMKLTSPGLFHDEQFYGQDAYADYAYEDDYNNAYVQDPRQLRWCA